MTPFRILDYPPVWLAACAGAAWFLAEHVPLATFGAPGFFALGWGLVAVGIALMLWSAIHFQRARTTLIPRRQPSSLVDGGPYRFSRNPIYLADVIMLLGWLLVLGGLSGFVLLPVFVAIIDRRFIRHEEAALKAAFPQAFAAFAERTRRWI